MESGLGAGKSRKINQMVAAFSTHVNVFGLCIHYHCLLSDNINYTFCIIYIVETC